MNDQRSLAEQFEGARPHLRAVAYRILGSRSEAEDAVQEAWLRLSRSEVEEVDNLKGWLTTVIARVCLDSLRARKARREDAIPEDAAERFGHEDHAEMDLQMIDSIGVALLVVLETLAPAERVAFVLHDMFNLSFEEIAPIVDRSPAATRQLASRARRRVRGSEEPHADRDRRREVVSAFLSASREGNFAALLALLDPNIVLRADAAALQANQARQAQGAPRLDPQTLGAEAVAKVFEGRARLAQLADIDGAAGLVFAPGGRVQVVFDFVIEDDRIVEISLIADAAHIAAMELRIADGGSRMADRIGNRE